MVKRQSLCILAVGFLLLACSLQAGKSRKARALQSSGPVEEGETVTPPPSPIEDEPLDDDEPMPPPAEDSIKVGPAASTKSEEGYHTYDDLVAEVLNRGKEEEAQSTEPPPPQKLVRQERPKLSMGMVQTPREAGQQVRKLAEDEPEEEAVPLTDTIDLDGRELFLPPPEGFTFAPKGDLVVSAILPAATPERLKLIRTFTLKEQAEDDNTFNLIYIQNFVSKEGESLPSRILKAAYKNFVDKRKDLPRLDPTQENFHMHMAKRIRKMADDSGIDTTIRTFSGTLGVIGETRDSITILSSKYNEVDMGESYDSNRVIHVTTLKMVNRRLVMITYARICPVRPKDFRLVLDWYENYTATIEEGN